MDINELMDNADDGTDGIVEYVTHARFAITGNEVFIDFYRVMPDANNMQAVSAKRVHRIAMSLNSAKDTSVKLTELVTSWENTFGISLPLLPVRDQEEEE